MRLIQHPGLRRCRASERRFACLRPGWLPDSFRTNHPTPLSADSYGTCAVLECFSVARVCVVVCRLGQTLDRTLLAQTAQQPRKHVLLHAGSLCLPWRWMFMPSEDRRTCVQGDSITHTHGAVVW